MEFLEKLIARPHWAQPLKAGSLSELAAETQREQWIDRCVAEAETQETGFAINLLMRAMRAADSIVAKIEEEEPILVFFAGTSRDVLLYEVLHFCIHGISDALRRVISPDMVEASAYFGHLAFMAAGELGLQHIGSFDAPGHRLERAQHYLRSTGKPRDMAESLIWILLCSRGRLGFDHVVAPATADADLEIQISLCGIVHPAAIDSIAGEVEILAAQYAREFDCARYERERASRLSLPHNR